MKNNLRLSLIPLCGVVAAGMICGQRLCASNTIEKILVGDTNVTVLNSYKGDSPLAKPSQVAIYDFNIPDEVITLDHSALAHILSHDPVAHMKGDAGRNDTKAAVAAHVQAAFSQTLVHELTKDGATTNTQSLTAGSEPPPNSLTVHGDFTDVKLGNTAKRMIIGFGRGASDVKAHVVVSLVTGTGPVLLAEFNLKSASGKKPGAAATMGVGVAASAATSAATDGKASVESDTSRMAKAVATQIEKIMASQAWIADPSTK